MLGLNNQKFQSKKMGKNLIFQSVGQETIDDYENYQMIASSIIKPVRKGGQYCDSIKEEQYNLQDLWNSLDLSDHHFQNKKSSIIAAQIQGPLELDEDEMKQIFGSEKVLDKKQTDGSQSSVENLEDIWNNLDSKQPAKIQQIKIVNAQTQGLEACEQEKQLEVLNIRKKCFEIFQTESYTSKKLNLQRLTINDDFLIYDYQDYIMGCYKSGTYSYLGFEMDKTDKNRFYLFDIDSSDRIAECYLSKNNRSEHHSLQMSKKIDYQFQHCLKFLSSHNGQHIASAFFKYLPNGILYNIKSYNSFEGEYGDTLAMVEIVDQYINRESCYCKTAAYLSQKHSFLPGELKMKIYIKHGALIVDMGVNGIVSSPYNCRLQNSAGGFSFLLGLFEKQSEKFIIRVGEGVSPLVAFTISVGRKRYIDSFKQ